MADSEIAPPLLVMDAPVVRAVDMLRARMNETPYKWVYRKLNNARLHVIFTHSREVPYESPEYGRAQFVTNGDVMPWRED